MDVVMEHELEELEAEWLSALRTGDLATLDRIFDPLFVCTPWSSRREVLPKREYLREARRTRLKECELQPTRVQVFGDFAIVRCQIRCEYDLQRKWNMDLMMTDVWVNRNGAWKALHRDASPLSAQRIREERMEGQTQQRG